MTDEEEGEEAIPAAERRRKRMWWTIIALVAAIAAGVLLASTVWTNRWNENVVPANAVVPQQVDNLESWCAAQATYDAIRRELFRRAAQVRGDDQQVYTRLADFALLRMSGPVARGIDDRLKSVTCSATAYLDLPPGVRTSGGQRSLTGDLDYIIQPAADGSGKVVRLGNADSIVVPLATLSGVASPPPRMPTVENEVGESSTDMTGPIELPESAIPPAPEAPKANPSFDCADASAGAEEAVCNDPGLASLDRQMAQQYRSAVMEADRRERRLLERTRDRFLNYRNRCATNQCIAETYRSRMREIDDIMSGRWRG